MKAGTSQDDSTLLDILIDGFEKNEVMDGFHWRQLPLRDEAAAVRKFAALSDEARAWKGAPMREEKQDGRRISAWPDLEIRQIGRGIMVRARAPGFRWWHDAETWRDDPIGPLYAWVEEERAVARLRATAPGDP